MAETNTLTHLNGFSKTNPEETRANSVLTGMQPRQGVVTLSGYGIEVRVERGHLILKDGVGRARREGRFPRVGRGIRRVVVIGADGVVSLAALQWLADQNAAFVMLERDGTVLAVTGPVSASDARIRRAQACVAHSGAVVQIVSDLIEHKLSNQAQVARKSLHAESVAEQIAGCAKRLAAAKTLNDVRTIESQGSAAYWAAWRELRIEFPKSDLRRVPDHWREFGSRTSPVSNRPRKAANPVNAMLNYVYAILEAETRLTIAAVGLDPGLGLLHVDDPVRDSLACDLMEPIRPSVDRFVLDWLARSPLKREWFFEQRDGTCRLMPELASRLGASALTWRAEIEPYAEWFAEAVRSTSSNSDRLSGPRTRLTRLHWRTSAGKADSHKPTLKAPRPQCICATCGAVISSDRKYCNVCAVAVSTSSLIEGARTGRIAAQSAEARERRTKSVTRHHEALQSWNPANLPVWLTNDVYVNQVQPRLIGFTRQAIGAAIGVSIPYAGGVRIGKCIPHQRHWLRLAELVGVANTNHDPSREPSGSS